MRVIACGRLFGRFACGGLRRLVLCILLRFARMLRLPTDGGTATLFKGDFEDVGLEGVVVPERAREVDENRAIEDENAIESGNCADQ